MFFYFAIISRYIAAMKDPNKPRGKTSSYAFFVATCREEHKKKHPGTPVQFAEFSKKCSVRWKVSVSNCSSGYLNFRTYYLPNQNSVLV